MVSSWLIEHEVRMEIIENNIAMGLHPLFDSGKERLERRKGRLEEVVIEAERER